MFHLVVILAITVIYIFFFGPEPSFGFKYIENFFSEEDFAKIKHECYKLSHYLTEEKNTTAENRISTIVSDDNKIAKLCNSETAKKKLKIPENTSPADVPIELRKYKIGGAMDWHKDTVLYTKPQYEMVYTVHNTSDSKTMWYDPDKRKVHEIETKPNSMIVVKADDVQHCVSPVTKGDRSIIKFAYTETTKKAPGYFINALNIN